MNFHSEILAPAQNRVLRQLGPVAAGSAFYLGGGTALALHFGHRGSVDFDFFTSEELDPLLLSRLLGKQGVRMRQEETERGTLRGVVSGVQVSFMEFPYPMLKPPALWAEWGVKIAAPEDLAAMKLAAIADRGSKRDFIDLYALTHMGYTLPAMLELYQAKFRISNRAHVLYGLAYFDDANHQRTPRMLWKADWKTIRATLQKRLDELV
jgi:predicted nucleotidyltransferase component of viral defense system